MESDEIKSQGIWASVILITVIGFLVFGVRACKLQTERDAAIGTACVEAGGSWIRSGSEFQCVGGQK